MNTGFPPPLLSPISCSQNHAVCIGDQISRTNIRHVSPISVDCPVAGFEVDQIVVTECREPPSVCLVHVSSPPAAHPLHRSTAFPSPALVRTLPGITHFIPVHSADVRSVNTRTSVGGIKLRPAVMYRPRSSGFAIPAREISFLPV